MWMVSSTAGGTGKVDTLMTMFKVVVGSLQVLGQLDFTLDIQWPGIFGWFIGLLKLLSFDLLSFLNFGCVVDYDFYDKWTFATMLIPTLLLVVAGIYTVRKGRTEGMGDRAAKMAQFSTFLCYPFVSQTCFQTFSCRRLSESESYLDVDY